jgi:hypothetical protein
VLLWAIGCALAWLILRHWTQGAMCAILVPWWLAGEWDEWVNTSGAMLPVCTGICALSLIYLTARHSAADGALRKSLAWIGGLALLPASVMVAVYGPVNRFGAYRQAVGSDAYGIAWGIALLFPLGVALLLDRRQVVWSAAAIAWTFVLAMLGSGAHERIATYGWCLIGAAGLAAWGIREARPERINLGTAGLAITVMVFYYSDVMDKLGRSASLIGIGLLFLGGGWLLERMRRHLMTHISREAL